MSYSSGRHFCGQKTSRRASTPLRRRAFTCAQPVPARLTGKWRIRASTQATIRSAAVSAGLKRRLYRGGRDVLEGYEREVRARGLMDHLLEKGREHHEAVVESGAGHSLGAIGYTEGVYLYGVLRKVQLKIAVETGVANGFSTAFSLLALQANGEG